MHEVKSIGRWLLAVSVLSVSVSVSSSLAAAEDPAARAKAERFFETEIRPLLAEKCFKCHAGKRHKGGLKVDSLAALLTGGDTGPALVRGKPGESLLIRAVEYGDPNLQMPPKGKLEKKEIDALKAWVQKGAIWPGASDADEGPRKRESFEITEEDRAWWAFQPIAKPTPKRIQDSELAAWAKSPIDVIIAERLEEKQLRPTQRATRRELIRRAYLDLVGLPPSHAEVQAFVADDSPNAWERLVDRLLASPAFGERWGRHWLDVVRFAQTNGYERDGEKPFAWRYRDYVIRSFNENKPYDRFVREQIAGDELDDATRDSIVATAFYRLGVWDDEPDDKRMALFEGFDDMVVATGASFLGMTVGCARCHDHMFDPMPQADYYRMLAFFRGVRYYENPRYDDSSATYAPLASPAELRKWQDDRAQRIREIETQLAAATEEAKKALRKELESLEKAKPPFEWTLAVRERGRDVEKTHVLIRGNAATPGKEVSPGFLAVFGKSEPKITAPPAHSKTSGRRRVLADWIASAENPLTARVMVNRVWQHLFGRGIVRTPNDFGRRGLPPTHPRLVDWLAAELIEKGWRVKDLIKTILLSNAYRMSSRVLDEKAFEADPGNDLFWHQNLRRLEAEAIRDSILVASGKLNTKAGGRGMFPHLSPDVIAGGSRPGWGWELSSEEERSRRSVYIYLKRGTMMPLIEGFDYTNTVQSIGARTVTTVAPQALMLLNSRFLTKQSRYFAARVVAEAGDSPSARVERAYQIASARNPTEREREIARDFLARETEVCASSAPRLVFRPAVPAAMEHRFQNRHRPEDYYFDAPAGFSYHKGDWKDVGDSINWTDPQRSPFALWKSEPAEDVEVRAKIVLHANSESAGIVLRATSGGDRLKGYEVAFDLRERRVHLRRHDGRMETLASATVDLIPDAVLSLRASIDGDRFRVWLEGVEEPLLDAKDPQSITGAGLVGVRSWGAALSVESLEARSGEKISKLEIQRERSVDLDALASLCLVLMNTNEFVYVD